MEKEVMLLRQVFPEWFKDGIISSQAFNPSPAHEYKLSSYSGKHFTGESSFEHYTNTLHKESAGCLGVTKGEYDSHDLASTQDDHGFEGHVSTDFAPHGTSQRSKKAKLLRNIASTRGWLFEKPSKEGAPEEEEEVSEEASEE